MDARPRHADLLEMALEYLNTVSRLAVLEDAPRSQRAARLASLLLRHLHAEADDSCPLESEVRILRAAAELATIRDGAAVDVVVESHGPRTAMVPRGILVRPVLRMLADDLPPAVSCAVTLEVGDGTVDITARNVADGKVLARETVPVGESQ